MNEKLTIYQPGGGWPNPHQCIESTALLNLRFAVFEGLTGYDEHMQIIPLLAETWTVSEDAKDWVFTIRQDVRFHDGTVLTAADAAASIGNASRKEISGAYGTDALLYAYLGSAKIEPTDPAHLHITLPEPMADLPDLLVYIMIIPEKYIGTDPETIPGTGPFSLSSRNEKSYVFLRNEKYWRNLPVYSILEFVNEASADNRVKALLEGKADIITGLNWSHTTKIDADDNSLIIENDPPAAMILMLNCFNGPFTDVRVRQAMNYGTDQEEIIQTACKGSALKLNGPVTPVHFGFPSHADPYPYDTGKAWKLLAEAGYEDGLELTMIRPTRMPDEAGAVTDCLKKQWARIGVRLNIIPQPDREQYSADVRKKQIHDLCFFDSAPVSTYRVLREKLDSSVRGPWWQGYDSSALNGILHEAARTISGKKREELYREAIRTVTDEAPWVFLYSPVRFFGLKWDVFEQCPGICRRADGVLLF